MVGGHVASSQAGTPTPRASSVQVAGESEMVGVEFWPQTLWQHVKAQKNEQDLVCHMDKL